MSIWENGYPTHNIDFTVQLFVKGNVTQALQLAARRWLIGTRQDMHCALDEFGCFTLTLTYTSYPVLGYEASERIVLSLYRELQLLQKGVSFSWNALCSPHDPSMLGPFGGNLQSFMDMTSALWNYAETGDTTGVPSWVLKSENPYPSDATLCR